MSEHPSIYTVYSKLMNKYCKLIWFPCYLINLGNSWAKLYESLLHEIHICGKLKELEPIITSIERNARISVEEQIILFNQRLSQQLEDLTQQTPVNHNLIFELSRQKIIVEEDFYYIFGEKLQLPNNLALYQPHPKGLERFRLAGMPADCFSESHIQEIMHYEALLEHNKRVELRQANGYEDYEAHNQTPAEIEDILYKRLTANIKRSPDLTDEQRQHLLDTFEREHQEALQAIAREQAEAEAKLQPETMPSAAEQATEAPANSESKPQPEAGVTEPDLLTESAPAMPAKETKSELNTPIETTTPTLELSTENIPTKPTSTATTQTSSSENVKPQVTNQNNKPANTDFEPSADDYPQILQTLRSDQRLQRLIKQGSSNNPHLCAYFVKRLDQVLGQKYIPNELINYLHQELQAPGKSTLDETLGRKSDWLNIAKSLI